MQSWLSNELYQASSNSDLDVTVAYGISEHSDVAHSDGLEMKKTASKDHHHRCQRTQMIFGMRPCQGPRLPVLGGR